MLEPAIRHTDELKKLFLQISEDLRFQYMISSSYRDYDYSPTTSTWNKRESVSVHNGNVIGYFNYSIDRDSDVAYALQIVNFTYQPNIIFAKDLTRFIKDIFEKYKHRKLKFTCYTDNPIMDSYERLCTRFGGRVVGVQKENDKLLDGEYHDSKMLEILRKDYLKVKNT